MLLGIGAAFLLFLHLIRLKENVSQIVFPKRQTTTQTTQLKRSQVELVQPHIKRACPICRTVLFDNEYLICAMAPEPAAGKTRQVHIYGCQHCFTTEGVNTQPQKI